MPAPKPRLTFAVFVVLVAALIAAILAVFIIQQTRIETYASVVATKNGQLAEQDAQLAELLDNYAALADDCTEAADCTTTTPSVEVIERTLTVQGTPGPAGRDATDGQVAEQVRAYCGARDDCRGPKGDPGSDGAAGSNGLDGAPGQDGSDGATGAQGPAGADGAAGQPPLSWTYSDAFGLEHACTRTDPFDPTNPTYVCN